MQILDKLLKKNSEEEEQENYEDVEEDRVSFQEESYDINSEEEVVGVEEPKQKETLTPEEAYNIVREGYDKAMERNLELANKIKDFEEKNKLLEDNKNHLQIKIVEIEDNKKDLMNDFEEKRLVLRKEIKEELEGGYNFDMFEGINFKNIKFEGKLTPENVIKFIQSVEPISRKKLIKLIGEKAICLEDSTKVTNEIQDLILRKKVICALCYNSKNEAEEFIVLDNIQGRFLLRHLNFEARGKKGVSKEEEKIKNSVELKDVDRRTKLDELREKLIDGYKNKGWKKNKKTMNLNCLKLGLKYNKKVCEDVWNELQEDKKFVVK